MVAIKIQSLEDIVKAYLQNLGFEGKKLAQGADVLITSLGDKYNTDNVLSSLDELIYKTSQQIWAKQKMAKEQSVAMFKLCFLLSDGAKKWDVAALLDNNIAEDIAIKMREKMITVTPNYKVSHMRPQVIETVQPASAIRKLIHKTKKA